MTGNGHPQSRPHLDDVQQPDSTKSPGGYRLVAERSPHAAPSNGQGRETDKTIAPIDDLDERAKAIIGAQVSLITRQHHDITRLHQHNEQVEGENAELTAKLAMMEDIFRQSLLTQRNAMMLLLDNLQIAKNHMNEKIHALKKRKAELNCNNCNNCETCEFEEEPQSGIRYNILSSENEHMTLHQAMDMIEQLNRTAKEMEQRNAELKGEMETLTLEIQLIEQTIEKHKAPCGCDRRLFRREKLIPHVDKAEDKFHIAMEARREKDEEKEATRDIVSTVIYTMMRKAKKAQFGKLLQLSSVNQITDTSEELLEDKAKEIADELVKIKQIRSQEVAYIIDQNALLPGPKVSVVATDIRGYRKICEALGAQEQGNGYIGMLESTIGDINVLNLKRIWNEMDRLSTREEEISGPIANEFCLEFFRDFTLNEEVRQTHDLEKLKELARSCTPNEAFLPITPEGFHKLLSVVSKIRMMHLSNTIENTVNPEELKGRSKHLRQLIFAYTGKTETNKPVFTCDDPDVEIYDEDKLKDNPHAIAVHSITAAREKQKKAMARKISEKDHDQSKNYGMSDIKDPHRFEVTLLPEDSRTTLLEGETQPPAYRAIKKILAIAISIFGTDIPDGKLKCSIETGSTNPNSTGNNFAFQLTFLWKCGCCVNGKHEDGRSKTFESWVELHIRLYMDSEERRKDHELYVEIKDRKIQRLSGVDMRFHDHLVTLAERVISDKEAPIAANHDSLTNQLSIKEREAKSLFMSLLAKDEQGNPLNASILSILMINQKARKTLLAAAKKFENHEILPIRNRKRAGLAYQEGPTELNIMAREVIQLINKWEKSPSSQFKLESLSPTNQSSSNTIKD